VCSPGRTVFTEEELKKLPQEIVVAINGLRKMNNMKPFELK
jgi:hypothetical protein